MNRFFLSPKQILNDRVLFPPDISHQIKHVLRLREGGTVEVLDNEGHVFRVELNSTSSAESMSGRILAIEDVDTEPKTKLSLCFGLSHRDKVEWILQKGTEVGISSFYPFISSRTLVQSTSISANKQERWDRIIREAAEQSRRGYLPILKPPLVFETCLEKVQAAHALCLLAWEGADAHQMHLSRLVANKCCESIAVFVGPEGGFSDEEIQLTTESECEVISLGQRILRIETAAIILPALVLHELREL
jgi:16S rRNA (uracil1498-N3)-methyltransferase